MTEIIVALISAGIPACITLVTALIQFRAARQNSAKQSILQMILEDKIAWIFDREFPTNYGRICDEFKVYEKAGGNGEVKKKVDEYKRWFVEVEATLKQK